MWDLRTSGCRDDRRKMHRILCYAPNLALTDAIAQDFTHVGRTMRLAFKPQFKATDFGEQAERRHLASCHTLNSSGAVDNPAQQPHTAFFRRGGSYGL